APEALLCHNPLEHSPPCHELEPPTHRPSSIAAVASPSARPRRSATCYALLRAGGDFWSWVLDLNAARREGGEAPIANYQALCRELTREGNSNFGELSITGALSILRRYADAWMTTAKKRSDGDALDRYLRRKRSLVPSRYYAGTFVIDGRRLRLQLARGALPLIQRLARELPYRGDQIRSVTLVHEANRLLVDICAEVAVKLPAKGSVNTVAGIDLGIINPFAVVAESGALIVSGRAIRAESRLHLADQKARRRAVARRAPAKGMKGSRRWRKYRSRTRALEARHRRRLSQARHEAAKL
ncbi:MAG TPA: hypothetical protein VIJ34_10075, partial [Acidimicrobiales bacterium]